MSLIQNIRENHSEITFDIMNESTNLNTSFVNAIRRTILSDIRVYCIDKTKVNFFENTSVMDNEMIAERLMLSPIRSDLPDIDYNMIEISCDKRNQDEDVIGVFLEDFRVIDKTDDKEIPIDDFFPYKKILICNLRYNQSVSFEAKLTFNRVADGGTSAYCPVSTCVHTFGIDEQAVNDHIKEMSEMEKKKFMTRDVQRFIAKNRVNEPLIYQMKIESIEQLSAKKIVWIGLNELKNRILAFYSDLQSQTSRIHIALGNVFEDIIEISVDNETDTLGNLISSYMGRQEDVSYSGYVIRHPLQKNVLFKCKLKENNTIENLIVKIGVVTDILISILDEMIPYFES